MTAHEKREAMATSDQQTADDSVWRMLREALIRGEHQRLYITNAFFRHAMNQFISLLPVQVDAIAENAKAADERRQAAATVTSNMPPLRDETML